jgi:hypothetical protein
MLMCSTGELMKFKTDQKPFHSLELLLLLSKGGEAYKWLCSHFLKCVVGSKPWARRHHRESLSDVVTESDESFVLLTLENNYDRWCQEFTLAPHDNEGRSLLPESRYTNSGSSNKVGKGSSRRFHGWSREGYLRFNTLHGMVKEDRKQREIFELDLKEHFETEHARRRQDEEVSDTADEEEIFPANDMFGVTQPE